MPPPKPKDHRRVGMPHNPSRVIAIGVSTGGPNALQYVFSQLPPDFPGCLVVVQHMPEGFTEMFARRLDESSAIEVKEAQSGDLLLAGRALICPGNRHIKVRRMEHGNIAILVIYRASMVTTVGRRAVPVCRAGIRQECRRRDHDRHG